MNELTLFTPIKTELGAAVAAAKGMTNIITPEQQLHATMCMKQCKTMEAAATNLKDTLKRPHIDANKMIDETYKNVVRPLQEAVTHLKSELLKFNAIETKRKEEERVRLIEEKRVADEKLAIEKARDVSPDPDVLPFDLSEIAPEIVARNKIIHEANIEVEQFVADKKHESTLKALDQKSVKGVQKVWVYEVTDEDQLPKKFFMIDEPMLARVVKAGGGEPIPGVRQWQEERMSVR